MPERGYYHREREPERRSSRSYSRSPRENYSNRKRDYDMMDSEEIKVGGRQKYRHSSSADRMDRFTDNKRGHYSRRSRSRSPRRRSRGRSHSEDRVRHHRHKNESKSKNPELLFDVNALVLYRRPTEGRRPVCKRPEFRPHDSWTAARDRGGRQKSFQRNFTVDTTLFHEDERRWRRLGATDRSLTQRWLELDKSNKMKDGNPKTELDERLGSYYKKWDERMNSRDTASSAQWVNDRFSGFGGPPRYGGRGRDFLAEPGSSRSFGRNKDDPEKVIHLVDPTAVPKGRNYFEHDERATADTRGRGRGRGGFRGGTFARGGGGFVAGDAPFGRSVAPRRSRSRSPRLVWQHDKFEEPQVETPGMLN